MYFILGMMIAIMNMMNALWTSCSTLNCSQEANNVRVEVSKDPS